MVCRIHVVILSIVLATAELGFLPRACAQASPQTRDVVSATASQTSPELKHGAYYALVIGIDSYRPLPHLETPVNDAREIAVVLNEQYGFTTQTLLDMEATRDHIIEALDHYRSSLKENDNLLIYYAGHGYFDKEADSAYWAPVDAGKDTYAHWIIAEDITKTSNALPARQVLIISDSCYSGMLTRKAASPDFTREDHAQYVEKMLLRRSRHIMSSGGNEPVQDSDASGHFSTHSVFANALLQTLSEDQETEFTAGQLFNRIQELVGVRAAQVPQYKLILDPRSNGGDFVFFRVHGYHAKVPGHPVETIHQTVFDRTVSSEQEAIFAALDRYASAFSSMDIQKLKQAWPSMTKKQEEETKRAWKQTGLKAVIVELRNRNALKIEGNSAAVTADEWLEYTFNGKQQPPQTNTLEIELAKNVQGTWIVSGVKGR